MSEREIKLQTHIITTTKNHSLVKNNLKIKEQLETKNGLIM